jgi:hypothetical protein
VKQTNLNVFFLLGTALEDIRDLAIGNTAADLMLKLYAPHQWLTAFIQETQEMNIPDSREAATVLLRALTKVIDFTDLHKIDFSKTLDRFEIGEILMARDSFKSAFEREYRYLDVFTVTAKGIYDTRLLLTRPEEKFTPRVRGELPTQTLADLKQAARCLAFDIPTACVFHICRATEALMLRYHEVLSGVHWSFKKRDWNIYIEQLIVQQAPKTVTDRLSEIQKTDRNVYAHPDLNATLEEAPILFELCTGVIFQMASEIDRKLHPPT